MLGVHISDDVITDEGKIDILKCRPLARMGYFDYTSVETVFEMAPGGPTWRQSNKAWKDAPRASETRPSDSSIRLEKRAPYSTRFHIAFAGLANV